jgi:hypothetical protein
MVANGATHRDSPSGETSLHSLLQQLIVAFANQRAEGPDKVLDAAGDSVEAVLGLQGPIQSLQFLGFVDHGIDNEVNQPV